MTTPVRQCQDEGYCINILDTPGHQDFSEDTYRTLMAADSAVMVIDAAKGVEAQTRKLFKVCAMRDIPIFTFINKMDREARDSFELLEELEKELGVKLFEKDSRHVRLTIYGEQFLPYAERASACWTRGWACCSRWRSTPSRWSAWAISTPSPPPSFPR